ncbi:MAG: hypothetical protein J2P22_20290 [Nocardioides sp.]|nr:hypothetical protein [Nocardioides sp.]
MLFSLDQVASLGNELHELHVDQEIIHTISADLTRNSDEVTNSGFETMHVSQTVFGESAVGGSLGYHHSLAHAKVADTLAAVLEDLHTFRLGLQAFQKAVDSADTQSASDLRKRHSAIDALARSADFAHTHQRNHYYHPAGGTHA